MTEVVRIFQQEGSSVSATQRWSPLILSTFYRSVALISSFYDNRPLLNLAFNLSFQNLHLTNPTHACNLKSSTLHARAFTQRKQFAVYNATTFTLITLKGFLDSLLVFNSNHYKLFLSVRTLLLNFCFKT